MLKKFKALLYSNGGNFIVSILMLAAFLLHSPLLMIITCIVWLYYLRFLLSQAKSNGVRVVYYVMCAVAVSLLGANIYILFVQLIK